jgi:hypothetical protein
MCALFNRAPDPYWAGFGGGQRGFYCCDASEEEAQVPASNAALVTISEGNLSAQQVEEEFKDLVDETWAWKVRMILKSVFALVFPSKES